MFGIIYGIENILNHKIYIGQTKNALEQRFKEHKKSKRSIGKAIRKYGEENFLKIVLEECETQEQLNECEMKWIKRLNCMTPNGYNRTAGGEGVRNFHHTEETRKQISQTMTGRKQTEEHKKTSAALKKSRKENPISAESRARQAKSLIKFYEDNPEMKEHLSEMTKKQFATPESRKKHSEIMIKYYAEKRAKKEKAVG